MNQPREMQSFVWKGIVATTALLVLTVVLAAAPGRPPEGERTTGEDCLNRARQAVSKDLENRGLDPNLFLIEPLGEVVPRPQRRKPEPPWGRPAVIEGRVTDPAGDLLSGVTVEYILPGTKLWPVVTTDTAGKFRLEGVESGEATLRFHLPGFKQTLLSLRVTEGEIRKVRVRMTTGNELEQITMIPLDPVLLPPTTVPFGVTDSSGGLRVVRIDCDQDKATPIGPDGLAFTREEFERVAAEIREFHGELLNLAAGPGRMRRYVSDDAVAIWSGLIEEARTEQPIEEQVFPEGLDPEEVRKLIADLLELMASTSWSLLEGISPEPPQDQEEFYLLFRSPSEFSEKNHLELKRRGLLSQQRFAEVEPYLRRALGEGLLAKVPFELESEQTGPSEVVYRTVLPPFGLTFGWREGRLMVLNLWAD